MLWNSYIFLGFFSIVGLFIGGPLVDKYDTKKTAMTALVPLLLLLIVLITLSVIYLVCVPPFLVNIPFTNEIFLNESLLLKTAISHLSLTISCIIFGL